MYEFQPDGNVQTAGADWISRAADREKITTLEKAVAQHVRPGMSIYLPSDGRAALRALIRHFWGERPQLTLIALRVGGSHAVDLLAAGLVRRVIGSSFGVQYPSFRPSKVMQRAFEEGKIEIECWSLMALVQRLMAGGLGVPFMATRSMAGSDLAKENPGCRMMKSPFSDASSLVVEALQPDIAFVHALAADAFGNALVPPPAEDDLWSTRAARAGCVVLAENIVSTDFLRAHPHLVKVPAYRTLDVCHAPFACHPDGYESGLDLGLPVQGYLRDTAHYDAYYEASLDARRMTAWLERWAVGIDSQDAYLDALGRDRVAGLLAKPSEARDWRSAYARIPDSRAGEWTSSEMMLAAVARIASEVARAHGLLHCLAGAGSSELAASLALYELRRQGQPFSLVNGIGRFGYEPVPVPQNKQLTATMLTNTIDIYGTVVGGADSRCLAIVGAAEIDVRGNVNSTRARGSFLVGSGGVNDAITGAAHSLVMMRQERKRMVPRVEFTTCPGDKVSHLVTDLGVFRKNAAGAFELARYFPPGSGRVEDVLSRVQERCGWPVVAAADLSAMPPPTEDELRLMRWLDPSGKVTGRTEQ